MRAALHRVESDCLKPIYDNVISKEETLELVVPDVSADIGKILDVRGQFLLASQKAKTDEIQMNGSVEVSVIYTAEDSGKVQYVMANIPLNITVPVMGADENSKLVSRWELCGLDARMLNPRKLLLRADVTANIIVYAPDKFVLWDNLSDGEMAPVYILKKEAAHTHIVGVRDKSFVVTDEYKLPAEKGQNAKMLCAETVVCVQDAKEVGNKVVIKAVSKTSALFLNESDGSIFDNLFTTQFSQIIEVDTYGDSIMNSVNIHLRDAEFTIIPGRESGFTCSASFQMVAQTVCKDNTLSFYIADAYSNEYKLNTETVDIKLMKCIPASTLMLNLRGKIKPRATLTEILYTNVSELCTETDGNSIRVSLNISGVGIAEGGEPEPIMLKLTEEETVELMKNQKIHITSVCCEKPVLIGIPQNAEISVSVEIEYCVKEFFEISAVSNIDICDDCPVKICDRPSLVVLCSERERDLWNLAKKYGSTVEMIENANKFGDVFDPCCRPLLIPRSK